MRQPERRHPQAGSGMMPDAVDALQLDEAGVVRLAELLALKLRTGDVVALERRARRRQDHVRARADPRAAAARPGPRCRARPSRCAQTYADAAADDRAFRFLSPGRRRRGRASWASTRRLETGAAIVEWPERVGGAAAGEPLRDRACRDGRPGDAPRDGARPGRGRARTSRRIGELMAFLDRQPRWRGRAHRLPAGRRLDAQLRAPRAPDGRPRC